VNLLEWQNYCSHYFTSNGGISDKTHIGLNIYQESIKANHLNALNISFPVIKALLGEKNFKFLCRDYLNYYSWDCESINEFGAGLGTFIRSAKQLATLEYLEEVANVEWLIETLSRNVATTFSSSSGGMEIWLAHQKEDIPEIKLDDFITSYWRFIKNNDGLKIEQIDSAST